MTAKKPFVIIGAGGHAKVVILALRSAKLEISACLDADPALKGAKVEGVLVRGGDELLKEYEPKAISLAMGVGGVRDTAVRKRVFSALKAKGFDFPPVVAASATVAASAKLGAGSQTLTHAVVHPDTSIGENTVVNTAAIVEHDCNIGAHAFIGPGAIVCGGATLGDGAYLGTGAIVLPGVQVGAGAFVGAGTVANKDVPAGGKMIGFRRDGIKD